VVVKPRGNAIKSERYSILDYSRYCLCGSLTRVGSLLDVVNYRAALDIPGRRSGYIEPAQEGLRKRRLLE
jgi:hypothetical protein